MIRELTTLCIRSNHVKRIGFSPLAFEECVEQNISGTNDWLERHTQSLNVFKLSFGKPSSGIAMCLKSHRWLAKDGMDGKILIRASRGLPKLTTIQVDAQSAKIGASEIYCRIGFLTGEELNQRGDHTLPPFIRALAEGSKGIRTLHIEENERLFDRGRRDYLENAARSLNVRRLIIAPDSYHLSPIAISRAFTYFVAVDINSADAFFGALDLLRVSSLIGAYGTQDEVRQLAKSVGSAIQQCRKLTELQVGMIGSYAGNLEEAWFSDVLSGPLCLLSLRIVTLKCMEAKQPEIIAFFDCVSEALESVSFYSITLTIPGTWQIVIGKLRSLKFSPLKELR